MTKITNKLVSTTEFVKLVISKYYSGDIETRSEALLLIEKYVEFVSQKPELWMFVGDTKIFEGWKYDEKNEMLESESFDIELGDFQFNETIEWFAFNDFPMILTEKVLTNFKLN